MQNTRQTFKVSVQEPFFAQLKNGIKKVEGRLNRSTFLEMKVGDQISLNEEVRLEIVNKTIYKTFRDMIIFECIKNIIPDAKSIDEAAAVYYKFYSKEDEANFGVASIEVRLI
jgi:ASC-1-like (ASCH) protein